MPDLKIPPVLSSWAARLSRLDRQRWILLGVCAGIAVLCITALLSRNSHDLPNMQSIEDIPARKATFFNFLAPIVESENDRIRSQREQLLEIAARYEKSDSLSIIDSYRLKSLAQQYEVDWVDSDPGAVIKTLRRRVDVIPVPLALVQAAKESGWGTSRFAREGNNLFGQWCYREGCGIVPAQRSGEAKHEVKVFDSIEDAISAYLQNINTGDAYRSLREIRERVHKSGKHADGKTLADGLLYYSQRREAYVKEVKGMLQQYHKFQLQQQQQEQQQQ